MAGRRWRASEGFRGPGIGPWPWWGNLPPDYVFWRGTLSETPCSGTMGERTRVPESEIPSNAYVSLGTSVSTSTHRCPPRGVG